MTGFVDLTADQYHADQAADVPTLSCSIAKLLCNESPLHAWTHHPKLNPEFERRTDEKFELGTVCHSVFLEGEAAVEIIEAENYRTKAAQEAKYEARVRGKIPLLADQWDEVVRTVDAAREQLARKRVIPAVLADGKPEVTITWDEPGGVVCRSRIDWLHSDYAAMDDLKFTSRSANPRTWSRTIFGLGYDIQSEFYSRGVERLTGVRPQFRLAVVEVNPPHAVSIVALAPDSATIARKKVDFAIDLWRRCLDRDEWPGFTDEVAYATLPAWEEAAWLEREEMELAA